MQINNSYKRKIRTFVRYFLGPLLFVWLSYSIYLQVKQQTALEDSWIHIKESLVKGGWSTYVFVFLLMFLNWGIETIKWQQAVKHIQSVNFSTAFKAILSGISFSVSTPNRVGEYLGRVLYMNDGNRIKAISLTIICSMSQLLCTLSIGLTGLLALKKDIINSGMISAVWLHTIAYSVFFGLVLLLLLYFRLSWMVKVFGKLPGMQKYVWVIESVEALNATLLLRILSLSVVRFGIFIAQYYLLYQLFNVELTFIQSFWCTSVSFLIMAIIPSIALFTDLGLRGQINLLLAGLFTTNTLGISLSSLSIWLINLILPALAGSLLIFSIKKLFKNGNDPVKHT